MVGLSNRYSRRRLGDYLLNLFMTIQLEVAFNIGDRVEYHNKIGKDKGIITGFSVRNKGSITYAVSWSDKSEKWHYDFELTKVE